ncbi:response regulator [Virgibacillus sp. Bac330]|uniref:response regulator transcription factor n=1 Tax=Virgibacillus sp. Bac330 TaxID=2419841 RepID=UPI000EF4CC98|nr:response regulator transcription factor [Virgibacillus sp. Bac330]
MINILLVDDHYLVGEGTKSILEEEKFSVHYLSTASKVLELDTKFDLYIIDIHMPDMSGIELAEKLLEKDKERKIILYTGFANQESLHLFTDIGISGVISKTTTTSELVSLIHAVLIGNTIVPLSIFQKQKVNTNKKGFTERELKILKYISEGLRNKEIAEKLFLADRSIEYRLTKIYRKLDVSTRSEAVKKATDLKLLDF